MTATTILALAIAGAALLVAGLGCAVAAMQIWLRHREGPATTREARRPRGVLGRSVAR